MAILWQKRHAGSVYQVRSAGRTRRLYTDGVFHSQYHPQRALAGGIWDLLLLPVFFRAAPRLERVLVLGVGGGAVIHQLRRYTTAEHIVGVELNPVHIQVARRFFKLDDAQVELQQADAASWLKSYAGPAFDLIIDDVFGEVKGEPQRAIEADRGWFRLLNRHLTRHGTLVMNFIGRQSLRNSGYMQSGSIRHLFKQAYQFSLPDYENYVAAFLKFEASPRELRQHLQVHAALGKALQRSQQRFTVRRLSAA